MKNGTDKLHVVRSKRRIDDILKCFKGGYYDEAERLALETIHEFPHLPFGWKILGVLMKRRGFNKRALEYIHKALELAPQDAEAHNNLGVLLKELGNLKDAERSYLKAIELKPGYADAYSNLSNSLRQQGRLEEAEASCRTALAISDKNPAAHSNLGAILLEIGKIEESDFACRKSILLQPNKIGPLSDLLLLNASMSYEPTRYLKDAHDFSCMVSRSVKSIFSNWSCSKSKGDLRVGFVSGDFRAHPVGFFLEGLLSQLQSTPIELYAYPTNDPTGEVSNRIKALFHSWVSLVGKSDEDAAHIIHNHGIHILIDLSGHTAKNRLPIFGWKPAPVQISWLGYFASTGLPEMDYILGDPFVAPMSEAHHFTEEIWQMPESYLCFTTPDQEIDISSLPAYSNGFVTFGCFNNLSKMTDEVVEVRAKILHAVHNSRLFLKDKQLGCSSGRNRILSRFAKHGITADRMILEEASERIEYLACYNRVDIALSPFPYGGGTTSVEGLWMGVPVITKKGDYFLSHLGETIAHNTNLPDWIAADNEEYIRLAIKFTSDLAKLAELRASLRERLLTTPLFNLPRFANYFEQALWAMRDSVDSG